MKIKTSFLVFLLSILSIPFHGILIPKPEHSKFTTLLEYTQDKSLIKANLNKPDFQWFWTLDGPKHGDGGTDMVVDKHGNMFISGHHGGIDLDRDGSIDLEADAVDPIFFKVIWNDDEWRHRVPWFKTAKAPGYNMQTLIAADQQGGAYVVGRFQNEITFDDEMKISGAGKNDSYIVRVDEAGNAIWSINFGGFGEDAIYDVTSDDEGNLYLIGSTQGGFSLHAKGRDIERSEDKQFIIASLDTAGEERWMHHMGSSIMYGFMENAPGGEIYISCDYKGAVDLDEDGVMDFSDGDKNNGFIARYSTLGEVEESWKVSAGPGKLTIASDGTVYLLGATGGSITEMYGLVDFNGDGLEDIPKEENGSINAWVAAFNSDGTYQWGKSYGLDRPSDIVTNDEWIVLTGSYQGKKDLDGDGEPEPYDNIGNPDKERELVIFLIDAENGVTDRVWVAPGPGNDHASTARFYPESDIIRVTGYIQLAADFSQDDQFNEGMAKCESLGDLFFAEYRINEK